MAANDFLKLARNDTNATEVGELLQFIDRLREAYELGLRIREKMRHSFDDSGGAGSIDWSTVETNWGIPPGNTSVGNDANGKAVFTFIDGAVGGMEGTFQTSAAKDITETVG